MTIIKDGKDKPMSITYTEKTDKGYEQSLMYKGWVKMYLGIDSEIHVTGRDTFDLYGSKERWENKLAEWGVDKKDYKIVNSQNYHTLHISTEDLAEKISDKMSADNDEVIS